MRRPAWCPAFRGLRTMPFFAPLGLSLFASPASSGFPARVSFVPPGKSASETVRSPDLSYCGGGTFSKGVLPVKTYEGANIRNVALVGHSHSGKTSLASAMLFTAGATQRLGRVAQGCAGPSHIGDVLVEHEGEEFPSVRRTAGRQFRSDSRWGSRSTSRSRSAGRRRSGATSSR
jgi:hypothetical protein